MQKEFSNAQAIVGLAANSHKNMSVDETLARQATNFQKESPIFQPIIGLTAVSRMDRSVHSASSQSIYSKQVDDSRMQVGKLNSLMPLEDDGYHDTMYNTAIR